MDKYIAIKIRSNFAERKDSYHVLEVESEQT